MNKSREELNRSNQLKYLWARFWAGLRAIPESCIGTALTTLYWVTVLELLFKAAKPPANILERLMQPIVCIGIPVCAVMTFVLCVIASAIPWGAEQIADAFRRVHVTNSVGEPPMPTSYHQKDGRTVMDVFTQGVTISQIQDNIESLESALGKRIIKIEQGHGKQIIRLHLAPGNVKLPEKIYLPPEQSKSSELLLGASLDGPVSVDLNITPHLLIAGGTGSGKSTLVKCLVYQLLKKLDHAGKRTVDVYIIDLKGGMDYPPHWRNQDCSFCTTAESGLSELEKIEHILKDRQILFAKVSEQEDVPCSSLDSFNRLRPANPLNRIVVVIDELAELTDTTGMSKPQKEMSSAIIGKLSMIARLGRAFGINLIISTKRPDANILPGQIKNNLAGGRICGKADNVLSQIILDNTDASTLIPKDSQGLFLDEFGTIFRGYLFDNSCQRRFKIVRKWRRNYVILWRGGVTELGVSLQEKGIDKLLLMTHKFL
ncbi:MAG: DUF87 domain-containing protein, partial [Lachnospiraceae bacterium]|nr:DUF87 domain-containing protein [Lachnospiraceae bacterium]